MYPPFRAHPPLKSSPPPNPLRTEAGFQPSILLLQVGLILEAGSTTLGISTTVVAYRTAREGVKINAEDPHRFSGLRASRNTKRVTNEVGHAGVLEWLER